MLKIRRNYRHNFCEVHFALLVVIVTANGFSQRKMSSNLAAFSSQNADKRYKSLYFNSKITLLSIYYLHFQNNYKFFN